MKMAATMKKLTLLGTFLMFSAGTLAQQSGFISLKGNNGQQVFVGTGQNAQRIGNAVQTRFHVSQIDPSLTWSGRVLFACNGSWISDNFQTTFHDNTGRSPAEFETLARANEEKTPLDVLELNDWQKSQLLFAAALRPHVNTICKNAAPEPRNYQIPVSEYNEDGGKPGGVASILTGSFSRKRDALDVWLRMSHFKVMPHIVNGKLFVYEGIEQKYNAPTGTYEMHRIAFSCLSRRLATYQIIEYNKAGKSTQTADVPREKLELVDVVPGSVGEAQLDKVCAIYSGKN
ncbi:hypothetical protein [Polaromonas sp. AER18D-145]|uniref:hypothetical protein n=1 Tax=Polaromonas sp. AER18D-145 TaxID=1977060 RepID=UPI001143F493|nr:hypothetical protein [Polaromonas sp. AER18D-145]